MVGLGGERDGGCSTGNGAGRNNGLRGGIPLRAEVDQTHGSMVAGWVPEVSRGVVQWLVCFWVGAL